jgi:hypothetical protein
MAEIYLTITQFEDLMQSIFCSLLGWTDDILKENVRISWPEKGMPTWGVEENIAFIRCYEEDDPYNKEREHSDEYQVSPDESVRETNYTVVMRVDLIIYGSEAFENGRTIRDKMYSDEETKMLLNRNHIYLKPKESINTPKRNDEYFQGSWWKRVDMSLRFNELVIKSTVMQMIDSVDVAIYEGDTGSKIADVNINNE